MVRKSAGRSLRHKRELIRRDERIDALEALLIDQKIESIRRVESAKLSGHEEAMRQIGALSGSATVAAQGAPPDLHSLEDALVAWERLRKPAPSTSRIYRAAVERLTSRLPELVVRGLTAEEIESIRAGQIREDQDCHLTH